MTMKRRHSSTRSICSLFQIDSDLYRAVSICEFSTNDNVVDEVVIMRIRRVAKVRQDATHMEHGRELNAKFAR
jgi:hypothetical protein